jgi:CubicO group peptidase (beta-lactamase class C family)
MHMFYYALMLAFGVNLIGGSAFAVSIYPASQWQTRTPAQVGLIASTLDEFRQATGNRAGVIIKDGYLIYSWGSISSKFDWASAAKPVVSTMLFYAIKELKLSSVNALIADLGWDLIEKDETMTFHHLANMTSGYALPERPGAAWGYNDYAIALYNKSLFDRVFKQKPDVVVRAASRLGVLQFQDGALYGTARRGYGLVTSPRDFARIGWFWLNKGNWRGTQRLPASYFDSYMKPRVPATLPRTSGGINDYLSIGTTGGGTNQDFPGQGTYGYNWWFNSNRVIWPDAPADTIQARGHNNSESMFIIPSRKLVVAFKGRNSTSANAFADANRYLKILMQAFGPSA